MLFSPAFKIWFRQGWRFAVVGLLNTLIDFGVLNFLILLFSWPTVAANTVSFSLAATNSYIFNKFWTFGDFRKNYLSQFPSFFVVALVGLGLSNLLMWLFVDVVNFQYGAFSSASPWWYNLVKIASAAVVLIWNFLASKFLIFKK